MELLWLVSTIKPALIPGFTTLMLSRCLSTERNGHSLRMIAVVAVSILYFSTLSDQDFEAATMPCSTGYLQPPKVMYLRITIACLTQSFRRSRTSISHGYIVNLWASSMACTTTLSLHFHDYKVYIMILNLMMLCVLFSLRKIFAKRVRKELEGRAGLERKDKNPVLDRRVATEVVIPQGSWVVEMEKKTRGGGFLEHIGLVRKHY
jgi:hypothetical protein